MKSKKDIRLADYQKMCARTARKYDNPHIEIMAWGLGAAGETGDLAGCIKKTYAHDHDQIDGIRENIGDTMWYLAMICNFYKWDLGEVLAENIQKLAKRYPKGFFTVEHASRGGKRVDWNER